jgi:cytochrome c-type biogenesis protein CcmH/NrfG
MEERNAPADILKTIEQEMDSDIHPILKMILDNIKIIGLTVGGVVAAMAVYSGVTTYQKSQHEKAVSEMGQILILQDKSARVERLQSFAQQAPEDLRPGIQLELARIFMDQGEYEKAATAWHVVGEQEGMRVVAGLGEAKALIFKGDFAGAVTILSAIKKDAGQNFLPAVSATLAFAAEKAGQTDLAIAEYESLRSQDSGNEAFLDYKIGRLKNRG